MVGIDDAILFLFYSILENKTKINSENPLQKLHFDRPELRKLNC